MRNSSLIYICNNCGEQFGKWAGRCPNCGEWNSFEEQEASIAPKALSAKSGQKLTLSKLDEDDAPVERSLFQISELDQVLGGGLVHGSAILLGGDPGIGKSTILLQAAASIANLGLKSLYFSGEEANAQIRMRAKRLGLTKSTVLLANATNLRNILETLKSEKPHFVVIDSIQTLWSDQVDSAPGTVSQVRAVVHELVSYAKREGTAIVLVGHVTKDGQIAGPRIVEHMVDTVLYFEGERGHNYRLLRAVKNRFGPAGEIGVFEMSGEGLISVKNPSALFLTGREAKTAGSAVFAGMEGSRPILVEIQALIAPSPYGTPRRAVLGWDQGRLNMILAVLETRAGVEFGPSDIYLNVAGGLRIVDPAADMAVAAALISAHLDRPLPSDAVFFGEIALSGALRPAPFSDMRLKEAEKLGFLRAVISQSTQIKTKSALALSRYSRIEELSEAALKRG